MAAASVGRDEFVNPYTFVPLPKAEPGAAWRSRPAGHDQLTRGRLSGSLDVEITARSPLLLRNVYDEGGGGVGTFPRRRVPGYEEPQPYIPGSSLAGTIRSLHETIAGGCLRVFNDSFRPGYRNPVKKQDAGWRLALITEVDEKGAPARLRLCRERTVWVDSEILHRGLGGPGELRSGLRVELAGEVEKSGLGRWELRSRGAVVCKAADGDVVVLVTHAGTRKKTRKNPDADGPGKIRGRYFCATGELVGPVRDAVVDDETWRNYLAAVNGTRDVQEARQNPGSAAKGQVPVTHPHDDDVLLGHRDRAAQELREGQVVWVRAELTGEKVLLKEVSLAAVWRHQGTGEARERVPEHLRDAACSDFRALCPSCRLFGSADTGDGSDKDGQSAARQDAYRGHVRFSDAVPRSALSPEVRHLPPMGSPRPGAGQFYLARNETKLENRTAETENDPPLREWGARDENGRRQLRGRKHYWLTGRSEDRPYFHAEREREGTFRKLYGADNKLVSTAESVPQGSVFTSRVFFENLTPAELGGLLSALDPSLLLGTDEGRDASEPVHYGWAVGGGRPLGFGTCTARVTVTSLDSAESRYLGADPPEEADAVALVGAFRRSVSKELGEVWKRLASVLRLDWAPADRVWYPPAGCLPGPQEHFGNPRVLKASFAFWKESAGAYGRNGGAPYKQLPAPNSPKLGMKVIKDFKALNGNGGEA
ncbi:TIGR03986 family CRISPR-associated RAMP protein [Streptomyces sp. B22F1]|uniref:TIGR03986 family type III CRISPR-associated RAMP protein n=1 Tax=Streptomyces sp. B22F1 TaxID=3153566 RepID=UPI00325CD05C